MMDEKLNIREQSTLLVLSFITGIIYDYLFYGKEAGISYPLFLIVFYVLFFWGMRKRIHYKFSFNWVLLIAILLLSLTYVLFSNELFATLNTLAIPLLVAYQTTLTAEKKEDEWFRIRFFGRVVNHAVPQALYNFGTPFRLIKAKLKSRLNEGYKTLIKVLAGLLIAMPVLFIVITLLAEADQVFGQLIGDIPSLFMNVDLVTTVFRIIWIVLFSVYIFGYIWGLLAPREHTENRKVLNHQRIVSQEAGQVAPHVTASFSLDPVIATTILTVINAVYILFVFVQFSYFFGGGIGALPDGITYAEYARKGFMELIAVTVINLSILVGVIQFVQNNGSRLQRFVQFMLSLLIALTIVILISAFLRLTMYEDAYGFTQFRLLAHAFIIFLFILFLLAFRKIWNQKVSLLKQYMIVGLVVYLIVNYMNIDRMVATLNVERYYNTGKIDTYYLDKLSYDAIPVLVRFNQEPNSPIYLDTVLYNKKKQLTGTQKPWQSFNWSEYRAKRILNN